MKIGFSGHRDKSVDQKWLDWVRRRFNRVELWIHGGANGFDSQVERFAKQRGIKTTIYLPQYDLYPPKTAPLTRNRQIVTEANVMIIAWDGRHYGGTFYTMKYCAEIGRCFICIPVIMKKSEKQQQNDQLTLNL
jgi:hypothetical protein